MLADHRDGLSWGDVVPWRPVVLPIGGVEAFLNDLLPPRQPVTTAHAEIMTDSSHGLVQVDECNGHV